MATWPELSSECLRAAKILLDAGYLCRSVSSAYYAAMMILQEDEKTIAQVVRDYIRDCHPGGVSLEVVEEGIRKIDYWWRVPIRPSTQPPHTFEYYDALAGVESAIQEDKQLNILLVPTLPE